MCKLLACKLAHAALHPFVSIKWWWKRLSIPMGPRPIMLEQLEERIVLDAAPVAVDQYDAPDHQDALTVEPMLLDHPGDAATGAPPAAGAASVPDLLQQVLGQNINDILITNIPGGIESLSPDNGGTAGSSGSQVLVVSSALQGADDLLEAAKENLITVLYDARTDTPADILSEIREGLDGRDAQSIAFATHDLGAGAFQLTGGMAVNLPGLLTSPDIQHFWSEVGDMLSDDGRIDLLACDLAATDAGDLLIQQLEQLTGHDVAASDDPTGNPASGGDWVLETHGVDLAATYFAPGALESFRGLLLGEDKLTASDGQAGDAFGYCVVLDGQWTIVGAPQDDDNGLAAGAAYVSYLDDGVWIETQKLTASDGGEADLFGRWVAIEGSYAFVGAEQDDDHGSNSGAVYVFHLEDGTWVETQKLTASDGSSWDRFGSSGDLHGSYAVIGAPYDEDRDFASGSAYVFELIDGTWVEHQKLTAIDAAPGDLFGSSISIDTEYALITSPHDDANGSDSGSTYVFHLEGSTWVQHQKLLASDGHLGDRFGTSVSISGEYAMVGAAYDAFAQEGFVTTGPEAGSVYTFHLIDGIWTQEQRITASYAGNYYRFGTSVSVAGEYAVVGSAQDDSWATDAGNAYLFHLENGLWVEQEMVHASDASESDRFGLSVSTDGRRVVVGAPQDDDWGANSGAAYVFSVTPPDAGALQIFAIEDTPGIIEYWWHTDPQGDQAVSMKIVEMPANVTLFLDMDGDNVVDPGEAVAQNQEISWADATANCLLKYVPDPNWNGEAGLRYCVSDGTDYGASASVSITVAALNDAPLAGAFTQAGKLDVFVVDGWSYTDAEGEPATALKIVGQSSSFGTLFLDADEDGIVDADEAIQVGQEIAWEDATTNGLVKFAPVVGINESMSVVYGVKDAVDYGPTTEATILAHANNSPVAEPFTETGGSNSAVVIDGWTYTDSDGDAPLLVRIESLPENGILFLDSDLDNVVDAGEAIVDGQDIPWAQATTPAGMVKFSPAANWTGTTAFSYSVDDGWGHGPAADAAIVVESNRAPVARSFFESGREQSVLVVDGWTYTDADGDPAVRIWMNSLPTNGTLFLDADGDAAIDADEAIVVGQTIPWADAKTNGLVKFLPAGEWYGSTTLSYSVDDGLAKGSAATGTIYLYQNYAPNAGSFLETGQVSTVMVIDGWSHSDGDPATLLKVTELPEHGVLFLDSDGDNVVDPGEAITVNQEIDWYAAKTAGLVKFAPDAEWYGTTTLTYMVRDWLEYGTSGQASIMNNKIVPADVIWSIEFGYSVSIDGDWAIIGAPRDSSGYDDTGSAYIYHHENDQWVEKQKLFDPIGEQAGCGYYGLSVSIDGDRAIVGEYGSAYVYHFDGELWVEQQRLTASDGWMWESFGWSVAIDGDHAIVGLGRGAYTYHWDGQYWIEGQKLTGVDGDTGDGFGASVALEDGFAIVGAPGYDVDGQGSGSAYLYRWDGMSWVECQKLVPSDGDAGDEFGYSVALDSGYALVGAHYDSDLGYDSGSAYVFRWDGASWVEEQKLTAANGAASFLFGRSVSLEDGYAIVGGEYHEYGTTYGTAYLFRLDGTSWVQEEHFKALDGRSYDNFGEAVAIDGNYAIVGAYKASTTGAVYIFTAGDSESSPSMAFTVKGDEDTILAVDGWDYAGQAGDPSGVWITQLPGNGTLFFDVDADNSVDAGEAIPLNVEIPWSYLASGGTVKFAPAPNWSGVTTFTYAVEDASGYAVPGEATIIVNPMNDAPVLDDATHFMLAALDPDHPSYVGTSVKEIIGSMGGDPLVDADGFVAEGIAVIGVDTANGVWEYTTDRGATWIPFGDLSDTSATLLASGNSATRIRFVPNEGWTGTVDLGITFRAWDCTSGSSGQAGVDVSASGGTSAFSTSIGTASIAVSPDPVYRLIPSDSSAGDDFGYSVSVDGDWAIVGAPGATVGGYQTGAAYLFHWSGASWVQMQTITPPFDYSPYDFAGSVTVHGDLAIVTGGPRYGEIPSGFWTYKWNGVSWVLQQHLEGGGQASIDGDRMANGGLIRQWTAAGWVEQQGLAPSDGTDFRYSVRWSSLDGSLLIVGSPKCDDGGEIDYPAAAYLFGWDGQSWVEQQKLTPPQNEGGGYGCSVSLDGDLAVVGAPGESDGYSYGDEDPDSGGEEPPGPSGTAYVYRSDGQLWVEEQALIPGDAYSYECGRSVSSEGDFIAVGDHDHGDSEAGDGAGAGAVYVWHWDGSSWVVQEKLIAFDAMSSDEFGWMVAQDSGLLIVGAPATDTDRAGSAYIYRLLPTDNVQEPPQAEAFVETGDEDTTMVIDGWSYTDPNGDSATALTVLSLPSNGILFLDSDGDNAVDSGEGISTGQEISWDDATANRLVKFAPAADWWGETALTYSVTDAQEYGTVADARIVVQPANDPNVAGLFVRTGYENAAVVIDGWNYTDPDGDHPLGMATAVTIHRLPSNGVLFLDSDGDNAVDADETISVDQEIPWADATVNQLVKFAPDLDWYGPTSLRYSVKDPVEYGSPAFGLIVVYPVNHAPLAAPFTETGDEDTTIAIDGWSYTDRDGDDATALTIHTLPSNGVLFLDIDGDDAVDPGEAISIGQEISWWDATAPYGMVKLAPDSNWYGETSLTYSVKDAEEYGPAADVTITMQHVNSPPDAGPFNETGDEDSAIAIDGWNYTDADGDAATALTVHTLPGNGVLFLDSDADDIVDPGEAISVGQEISWTDAADGQLVKFVPDADWYGVASLSYSVKDAEEYGTVADVTITVLQVNSPPEAGPFTETGDEDTTIVIDGWNCTDADGDTPTVLMIHTLPSNGVLFLDSDGDSAADPGEAVSAGQEIAWTDATANQLLKLAPDANWYGSTGLSYSVKDSEEYGTPADATILIQPVNDPPQAGPFVERGDPCKTTVVDGWNYTDADGDAAAAIRIYTLPESGKLFLDRDRDNRADCGETIRVGQEIPWEDAASGMIKFIPSHTCSGSVMVTYSVTDGKEYGPQAQGTIVWGHYNSPPAAGAFTETGAENSVMVIDGWNFTDADGDSATSLKVHTLPGHGTLFLDRDGDNRVDCGEKISACRSIDWDDATSGMVKFAPDRGWDGETTFTYSVSDGRNYGARAEADIIVESWNTPPVAGPFTESGPRKEVMVIDGWTYTDADGDTALSVRVAALPKHGTLFLDRDGDNRVDCHEAIRVGQEISWDEAESGMVKYDPKGCWKGTTSLKYQVSDGWELGPAAQATITVTPKNHRPNTQYFVESGTEDTVTAIDGWSIKKDKEGDPAVSVTIHTLPKHGTLFLDADGDNLIDTGEEIVPGQVISWADATTNQLVKFAPDADWHGNTEFLHSVNDRWNEGSKVPARILVENDNADGPVAGSFTETVTEPDTLVVIDGWTWTASAGNGTATLEITSIPANGTLFVDKDGDATWSSKEVIEPGWKAQLTCSELSDPVRFLPEAGWTGTTTFTYRVSDGTELGPEAEVSIIVTDTQLAQDSGGSGEFFALMALHEGSPYDDVEPVDFDGEEWYPVHIRDWGTPWADGYSYRPSGEHNEIIYGTSGDDFIDCSGLNARYIVYGGDGADTIYGGNLNDYLHGWGETLQDVTVVTDLDDQSATGLNVQRIYGNGGADWIQGGPADEYLYGDSDTGDSSWSDKIGGGAGNDVIFGDSQYGNGSGADNIDGGEGSDTIYGDTMYGTGSGGDEIAGSGGNDFIYADSRYGDGCGLDTVSGGDGHDTIYGDSEVGLGSGADQINGGTGNDVIYADSRLGSGTGDDEADGGDGADVVYGDSYSGSGSGRDRLYGGSGSDLIFGDSMMGAGSGRDYLFGDEDSDQLYGDSYLAPGSGNDVVLGGSGSDLLVGDSYLSAGTGLDLLDGGMDSDVVYGDSVEGQGSGSDIAYGGEGDDLVVGDSAKADGSGHDWIDGGAGTDTMYGDTELGENLGHDLLIRGEAGEAAVGQAKPGDTAIPDDIQGVSYSYDVNGYTAQYSENPDTGEIQAYDYELGKWDTVGERCWDAERSAWVTNMGQVVIAEYAGKTIQYENYGNASWILENGAWRPYSPDDQYVVDFKEDPVTGELLVYDNDLQTWDPYMREYAPAGKDYTVLNEGDTILIKHNDGCVLRLESYGDGAAVCSEATGHRWVELPSDLVYRDATNIWYSYGWGAWSYSIDLGTSWKEIPTVQIRFAQDGTGSGAAIDLFDGLEWTHHTGGLEFFDTRYGQSGWHPMGDFCVEYYDGIGYDGEPLMVVDAWDTDASTYDPNYEAVLGLPATGAAANPPPPDAVITYWESWIYGQWSYKLLCQYSVPNPSPDYRPGHMNEPSGMTDLAAESQSVKSLNVVLHANDCPSAQPGSALWNAAQVIYNCGKTHEDTLNAIEKQVRTDAIYLRYSPSEVSLEAIVERVTRLTEVENAKIHNLWIIEHGNVGKIKFGMTEITAYDQSFFRNYESFKHLGSVLTGTDTDPPQIMLDMCNVAGPNPYDHFAVPANREDKPENAGTWEWQSVYARRLLSSVAQATGATVFASSDRGVYTWRWDFSTFPGAPKLVWTDGCLELGIARDGTQVPATQCDYEQIWDITEVGNLSDQYHDMNQPYAQCPIVDTRAEWRDLQKYDPLEWPQWRQPV